MLRSALVSAASSSSVTARAVRALRQALDDEEPAFLQRGRIYAREGRVKLGPTAALPFRAVVKGTETYQVSIDLDEDNECLPDCTCRAFADWGSCKHVVATVVVLLEELDPHGAAGPSAKVVPLANRAGLMTDYHMVPAHKFLQHLALFAGQTDLVGNDSRADGRQGLNASLGAWRQGALRTHAAQVKLVDAAAKKLEKDFAKSVEALESFEVDPAKAAPELVPLLVELEGAYSSEIHRARWMPLLPLPDDARFPGWQFSVPPDKELIVVQPRAPIAFLGKVSVDLDTLTNGRFRVNLHESEANGVQLAALRALILELMNKDSELHERVRAIVGAPPWEKLLERVGQPSKSAPEVEYGFQVGVTYGYVQVQPLRRIPVVGATPRAKNAWRKATLPSMLAQDDVSELEREISTLATMFQTRTGGRTGGADGFLLMSRLSAHPNVFVDAAGEQPLAIVAGDVCMKFDRASDATIAAHLAVGSHTLHKANITELLQSKFLLTESENMILAARLPASLTQWAMAALRTRDATLEFPAASQARLRQALVPLRDAVHVANSVMAELYGVQVPYTPRVGLSVEWGEIARVTLLIEVAEGAPLIVAGEGHEKFSFSVEDNARWVLRDRAEERALLPPVQEALAQFLDFSGGHVGATLGLVETLAFSEFVEANPLGLRIESRVGTPQKKLAWEDVASHITVAARGAWFALKGSASFAGHALPLGDLLKAIRSAQRFVALGSSFHLEITDALREQLLPLAFGAEGEGEEVLVHQGFGNVLAKTRHVFQEIESSIDWKAIERKHKASAKAEIPKLERGELRDYQEAGVRWMTDLSRWAPGCVLADDMGLGKTVQTATMLLGRRTLGPALVVAPASVTFNWKLELERFAPTLNVVQWGEGREIDPREAKASDVLIVSYGLLQRVPESFARLWSTVVLDEVQFLKNHLAKRTAVVRDLQREFTIALSGTPLENHIGELWSVVSLAFPGLLGTEPVFRRRFRDGAPADAIVALNALLAPFLLRRTRKEVLDELPERQDIDVFVDLSEPEAKKYESLRRACELQFVRKDERLTLAQHKIQMLAALTRLRQLACDASLVDKAYKGESSKLLRLSELCEELREQGAAVLVFSQFTKLLEKARARVAATGARVGYLDGGTPIAQRKRLVETFQAGEFDAFFISLKAGGTGLNLTRASYVIHLDPWWNPAVEEQANSRAHRMGQKQAVTAYRLIARGTIEESILSLHAYKRDLALSVLEGKGSGVSLSTADFIKLVQQQEAVAG
jgi:superfamily II DNA or RNA helicase